MNVRLLTRSSPEERKTSLAVVMRVKLRDLPDREKRRGQKHVLKVPKDSSCKRTRCEIMSTYGTLVQASGDANPLPKANETVVTVMRGENSYPTITTTGMRRSTRPSLGPKSMTKDDDVGIRDLLKFERTKASAEDASHGGHGVTTGGRRSLRSSESEGRQGMSHTKRRT